MTASVTASPSAHHVATFPSIGTTAVLMVTEAGVADEALAILRDELRRIDLACSRFRDDSDLVRLNERSGRGPVRVTPLLLEAVEAALRAARVTAGRVDPTVGTALELIGYDRDFASIASDGPALTYAAHPVPGWRTVRLDRRAGTVALPAGVSLDLGATAKAFCADRAAASIAAATGAGALVSLGGDIAVSGPCPRDGWPVRVGDDHSAALDGPGPVIAIRDGGLATSSTTVRTWRRGGEVVHHLIDPASSRPVASRWRTVSVAAGSCLDANVGSCAALVMDSDAPAWLEAHSLPARLVAVDGAVTTVAGWPDEALTCC